MRRNWFCPKAIVMIPPFKIIIAPDPVLKERAQEVHNIDAQTTQFMRDMLSTMYHARGVGLAAPQIGISQRIIVIDPAREGDVCQPIMIANPEIIWRSEEPNVYEEGCLSLPDFYTEIERPAAVRFKYQDETGKVHEMLADGFLATVLQHEIDHLDGILLLDRVSKLKRDVTLRRLIKLKKDDEIL